MKKTHFNKMEFQKVKFFKLKKPTFSNKESEAILIWCQIMGYEFHYSCDTIIKKVKAIVIKPGEKNKIGYLQKVGNEIRLVFNNRYENITPCLMISRVLNLLTPPTASRNLINFVLDSRELEYVNEEQSIYRKRNNSCTGTHISHYTQGV